jgi:hypothetical protein
MVKNATVKNTFKPNTGIITEHPKKFELTTLNNTSTKYNSTSVYLQIESTTGESKTTKSSCSECICDSCVCSNRCYCTGCKCNPCN